MALGVALVASLPLLVACQPRAPLLRVTVVGDSLTSDAADELASAGNDRDLDVGIRSFSGHALCQMVDAIGDEAAKHPDALVIQSAGNANAFTPCALVDGRIPTGQPYLDLYARDLRTAVDAVHRVSPATEVVVVGIPPLIPAAAAAIKGLDPHGPQTEWASDHLNAIYQDLAASIDYTYVAAGTALAGADGAWTGAATCRWGEPCVGNQIDPARAAWRQNILRSPDMLHLCPIQLYSSATKCPVYSSGARRYAAAILDSVRAAPGRPPTQFQPAPVNR